MPRAAWILAAVLCSSSALAQTPAEPHAPNDIAVGVTLGVPGYRSQIAPELLVVGLDILRAKPSQVGVEFALGTIPRILSDQAVVLGARLDATLPIALNDEFWLIPVAGGTMIGGGGGNGGGAFGGINAGIGSILWAGRVGVRTSATWHHFVNAQGAIWLLEFGIVGGR
jgi:hypothetical protein